MASDESRTTSRSSRLSQFGIYRNIDARTEEFLRLSRKRQIRQGCACAAVSTAITVTVVVTVLLVYEYTTSIGPIDSEKSRQTLWHDLFNNNSLLFDYKFNKTKININPSILKLLPLVIQALNHNRFLQKLIEDSYSTSHDQKTFVMESPENEMRKKIYSNAKAKANTSLLGRLKTAILNSKRHKEKLKGFRNLQNNKEYQRVLSYFDKMTNGNVHRVLPRDSFKSSSYNHIENRLPLAPIPDNELNDKDVVSVTKATKSLSLTTTPKSYRTSNNTQIDDKLNVTLDERSTTTESKKKVIAISTSTSESIINYQSETSTNQPITSTTKLQKNKRHYRTASPRTVKKISASIKTKNNKSFLGGCNNKTNISKKNYTNSVQAANKSKTILLKANNKKTEKEEKQGFMNCKCNISNNLLHLLTKLKSNIHEVIPEILSFKKCLAKGRPFNSSKPLLASNREQKVNSTEKAVIQHATTVNYSLTTIKDQNNVSSNPLVKKTRRSEISTERSSSTTHDSITEKYLDKKDNIYFPKPINREEKDNIIYFPKPINRVEKHNIYFPKPVNREDQEKLISFDKILNGEDDTLSIAKLDIINEIGKDTTKNAILKRFNVNFDRFRYLNPDITTKSYVELQNFMKSAEDALNKIYGKLKLTEETSSNLKDLVETQTTPHFNTDNTDVPHPTKWPIINDTKNKSNNVVKQHIITTNKTIFNITEKHNDSMFHKIKLNETHVGNTTNQNMNISIELKDKTQTDNGKAHLLENKTKKEEYKRETTTEKTQFNTTNEEYEKNKAGITLNTLVIPNVEEEIIFNLTLPYTNNWEANPVQLFDITSQLVGSHKLVFHYQPLTSTTTTRKDDLLDHYNYHRITGLNSLGSEYDEYKMNDENKDMLGLEGFKYPLPDKYELNNDIRTDDSDSSKFIKSMLPISRPTYLEIHPFEWKNEQHDFDNPDNFDLNK